MLISVLKDFRFAGRVLIKQPTFSLVVVLTLALGIGATTAMFSIVNGVLFKPLPFQQPEDLTVVWSLRTKDGKRNPISYPDFQDWRALNTSFQDLAVGSGAESLTFTSSIEAHHIQAEYISENFFSVLGVSPLIGRAFLAEENSMTGPNQVAILNHSFWQRQFGGSPSIIGKTITLNDAPYTVVGVMPEGFRGESDHADMWLPFCSVTVAFPSDDPANQFDYVTDRRLRWVAGVGRLKPGISLIQAQTELDTIAARLEAQYPVTNTGFRVQIQTMTDAWVGEYRTTLQALLLSVGLILLIACSNVVNLQMSRSSGRQKEMTVRTALGASRWQLVRLLLIESLILTSLGSLLGVGLALWLDEAAVAFLPVKFPSFVSFAVDWSVLGMAIATTVLSTVMTGLFPALALVVRPDIYTALREKTVKSGRTQWFGSAFAVAEIALALMLLVAAGITLKTLVSHQSQPLGFESENLLTLRVHLGAEKYATDEAVSRINRQLETALKGTPRLTQVGLVQSDLPPTGGGYTWHIERQDQPASGPADLMRTSIHRVNAGFFDAFGMRLLRGEGFSDRQALESQKVAVISESMARTCWGEADPIGKQLRYVRGAQPGPWFTVVGVVSDIKFQGRITGDVDQRDIYVSIQQVPSLDPRFVLLALKYQGETADAVTAVQSAIHSVDPLLPVDQISTMTERLRDELNESRFVAQLSTLFAGIALMLSLLGVYGVLSWWVSERTSEIGIRVALGAQSHDILNLVLKRAMLLTGVGIVIGLAGARVWDRWLQSLVNSQNAIDGNLLGLIVVFLVMTSLVTSIIPAWRAAQVDPLITLNRE